LKFVLFVIFLDENFIKRESHRLHRLKMIKPQKGQNGLLVQQQLFPSHSTFLQSVPSIHL